LLPHNPLRSKFPGLFFYNELMHIFYHKLLCDYKNDAPHVEKLNAAVKAVRKQTQNIQDLGDKLQLALPSLNGEWLPKSAVYALVDQIVVVFMRPEGQFKDCGKRMQSRMRIIQCRLATDFAMCVCITTSFEFGSIYCLWHISSDCKYKC